MPTCTLRLLSMFCNCSYLNLFNKKFDVLIVPNSEGLFTFMIILVHSSAAPYYQTKPEDDCVSPSALG